jgi:hypothetical protein
MLLQRGLPSRVASGSASSRWLCAAPAAAAAAAAAARAHGALVACSTLPHTAPRHAWPTSRCLAAACACDSASDCSSSSGSSSSSSSGSSGCGVGRPAWRLPHRQQQQQRGTLRARCFSTTPDAPGGTAAAAAAAADDAGQQGSWAVLNFYHLVDISDPDEVRAACTGTAAAAAAPAAGALLLRAASTRVMRTVCVTRPDTPPLCLCHACLFSSTQVCFTPTHPDGVAPPRLHSRAWPRQHMWPHLHQQAGEWFLCAV